MAKQPGFTPWFRTNPVFSLIYGIICFPVYAIARLIPKDPNLHIFGSFYGKEIGLESRRAFELSTAVNKYLITKNRTLLVAGKAEKIVYAFSPRGLVIQIRAARTHYSHAISDLVAPLVMGSVVVALGYGIPVKRVGFSDPKLKWVRNPFAKKLILIFFPYLFNFYCNEVVSPYKFFDEYKLEMYGIASPTLVRPYRVRHFSDVTPKKSNYLFAPTYRNHQTLSNVLDTAGIRDERFLKILEQSNSQLFIHPHYLQIPEVEGIQLPKRVHFLLELEISVSLTRFSGFASDYSSFFFEAAEAEVPIAFVANDVSDYESREQKLLPWFREILEERAFQDLCTAIEALVSGHPNTKSISAVWRNTLGE